MAEHIKDLWIKDTDLANEKTANSVVDQVESGARVLVVRDGFPVAELRKPTQAELFEFSLEAADEDVRTGNLKTLDDLLS